ncbi:uncharacterized protein [Blastocystis hominis]|uniref:Rab-GAP TBC domain-containing protein n=1 Tax=Blastocystis hominis TaxID=12968 RepID=D8M9V4_BLAHO|nr:uncharacterized protein [Blastocystis hominis]CBK24843.2 unnamed protein product [Blastocystis hominis]|eukprot:XP_012898891.1 uncharacterized protein [Blastocystis hominis]
MGNICFPKGISNKPDAFAACGTRTVATLFDQINDTNRIKLWREAFRIVDDVFLPKHCRIKYEAVKQIVFKNVEINYEAYPTFGVTLDWDAYGSLSEETKNSAIRLFLVLSEMNDMYFSPILPGMILMLMNYISEEEVYIIISSILENVDLYQKYLILNQRYEEAFIENLCTINRRFANSDNVHFSQLHPSLYGYILHAWMPAFFALSPSLDVNVRFFDAFVDRGFWLFAAFYVAYLNRYCRDLEYEMGTDDESNVSHVLEHIKTLSLDDVELLLADSIHLTFAFDRPR